LRATKGDFLGLFSIAVAKYLRPGNLQRMKVYLACGSGVLEVHEHSAGICSASGESLPATTLPYTGAYMAG
jgi:hypothetical protein